MTARAGLGALLWLVAAPLALAQYVGKLTLEPQHGPVGTPVLVRGTGLPPATRLELVWTTVRGRWKVDGERYLGREYLPASEPLATVHTDASGGFSAQFRVPEDFGFMHDVELRQGDRVFTRAGFSVDMTMTISPASGPAGTPITVEVKGIGWRHLQNSWLLLYDNATTGWVSAVTTRGSTRFTIPAAGKPGVHVLELLHGDFTFPYRNMQQSPEPDRPRFVKHFSVTPGAPVLPPPASAQAQRAVKRLPASQGGLAVSPAFAAVAAPVAVRASGLDPGKRYELAWSTVLGNRVAGEGWGEATRVIASGRADLQGALELRFSAPDDLGGLHALAVGRGAQKKTGLLWIAPSARPLTVNRGPAGTPFTIQLKGVGWTETANIYTVVYDNRYIGYACGFNSQGDVQIELRASGEPGWHFIDLYPAIYKGTEARPVNFRLPQLTYEADHPGEDLPAFRFAFEVTAPAGAQ
ncbi:MAG TPA: hypothetical protein VFC18_18255 [Burkholderiales bacterium]|nr:hypothetical protein [Burkholderiales bacterium]